MDAPPPLLGPATPPPAPPPPPEPLAAHARDAVERAFSAASDRLLGWPQAIGGAWIDRPELDRLHGLVLEARPALALLLGDPGVGKSALLARLGERLQGEGVALLALKADQLPRGIGSLADLDREIGAPVPVADALRRLAAERRTVLLIDQLDALADLMDQHSGRLGALLRLVHEVRGTANLHVILSCRAFEHRHDPRLSTLKADPVTLDPPAWDQVKPLLDARGIASDGWSDEVTEVLRTPQHLALFIDHLAAAGDPAFASYHAMLEAVIDRLARRHGAPVVEAAERVAIAMAEEEELALGRVRFADADHELLTLEREGLLIRSGARIAFRHQTVFDFLRSRAFLRTGTSLAEFVIGNKQESLFVRPTLWSALVYVRTNDPAAYKREFRRLWGHDGLRTHLRELLAAFLGQLADPDPEEVRWLLPRLSDPVLRRRTLNAMAGRPGWFAAVRPQLPGLMGQAPETAWELVWFLSRALPFAADAVVGLVRRHWSHDRACSIHAVRVLEELRDWTDDRIELAAEIAGRANLDAWNVCRFAGAVAVTRPDRAPTILARFLEARLDAALADRQPVPPRPSADAPHDDQWRSYRDRDRARYDGIEKIFDSRTDWHGLEKLASQSPQAFVESLWPWLLRTLDALAEEPDRVHIAYRDAHGSSFRDRDHSSLDSDLHTALMAAVRGFAVTDPDAFLAFVDANKHRELMVVHHFLAIGLAEIAGLCPHTALSYLLEDGRRFAIGDYGDVHRDSKRLITALAPGLAPADMQRLERAILSWERYVPNIPGEEAARRFERRKWTREHRLRLLRAIPEDQMSDDGRRLREQEERAFPHTPDYDVGDSRAYYVGSPVPAERMLRMSDEAIIELFKFLTDDTGSRHPRRRLGPASGGSEQASRAFEELAKADPTRALRIIGRFEPGRQERPTGAALRALSGHAAMDPMAIIRLVHDLDRRGFTSEEFRTEAARSLATAAERAQGLPDETVALLSSWLVDWAEPEPFDELDKMGAAQDEGVQGASLLWAYGGIMLLPHGNFPVLDAMAVGYLCRQPTDADGWLGSLDRHLARRENPEVWLALSERFPWLQSADRPQALAFLDRVFELCPTILDRRRGAILIANILSWLPPDRLTGILDRWIEGAWPTGPQAAAEILTLAFCRNPDDAGYRERVERCIDGTGHPDAKLDGLRLGVAHTLVRAWQEPALRGTTTELLERLVPLLRTDAQSIAISSLVNTSDPLPPDDATRRILLLLSRFPCIFDAEQSHFIGERMKDLLACGFDPDVVYAASSAIVRVMEKSGGDRTSVLGDLTEIAIALHRMPETRRQGLELFERLMLFGGDGIGGALKDLDRRPFTT